MTTAAYNCYFEIVDNGFPDHDGFLPEILCIESRVVVLKFKNQTLAFTSQKMF